jgi:hypothetical protein
MSVAMRVRKSDENTPSRPHYSDSRPTGQKGSAPAPVRVIHMPNEAVHQEQYQQTPKSAWGDENDERLKDRSRGQEPMPRRRMYNDEAKSRPPRSEERKPVASRHGSSPMYRDHTPKRETDRYGSQEQFDVRDPRQPPTITVTPPDEQSREIPRPRQYRRFSGSGLESETQMEDEAQSPVYSRNQEGRPPVSSYHRTTESQRRAPERQPTTKRSQTPQRSPVKQTPDSSLHERHPSSPSRLRGQTEPPLTKQQDMYETGQLVNWRDVAHDYGVDVNDDYPYFGVVNNATQTQQSKGLQYKDCDNSSGEPVVASSETENYKMETNGIYRDIPEPSSQKTVYRSHRRAQSLDNRNRSNPSQNPNSYGQYNGDSVSSNSGPPPSSPLKGNPQLRDSPTHRSASSISQMSSVSHPEQDPPEMLVYTKEYVLYILYFVETESESSQILSNFRVKNY